MNMKDLLPANKPKSNEMGRLVVQTSDEGIATLVQLPSKRKPLTYTEYQAAWRSYKAVYLEKYPNEVQSLLVFENDVFMFANQGLDWETYDEQFRHAREANNYPWDAMRPDLEGKLNGPIYHGSSCYWYGNSNSK